MKKNYKQTKKPEKNYTRSPAITHNENDLWQDLTKRTAEKYNRVNCGKGSAIRLPDDWEAFGKNWDSIKWN